MSESNAKGSTPENLAGQALSGAAGCGRIPVFQPHIGVDTLKAVVDAFSLGWLGMGSITREFEEAVGCFLGLKDRHVVATNTGTSALQLALAVGGIGPGDEVIVPSFNFVADQQAITALGAEPVFCDIRDDNLGIDCAKAEPLISPKTRAIMPLHYSGIPCDLEGVYSLASRHGLRVIEDATHAFGTAVGGKRIGSFGDLACFSFDPVKVVTSIDGGAVVVQDAKDVERLHHMRLLGIDRDTIERYKNKRAWEYDVVGQGFRYHLSNINASIGLSQLRRADEFISNRQSHCRAYNGYLAKTRGVITPRTDFTDISPFIYYIRVLNGARASVMEHLRTNGIDCGIHFKPVHRYTFYKHCRKGDLSVTERVAGEVMTLPLHSLMGQEVVARIASKVIEALG